MRRRFLGLLLLAAMAGLLARAGRTPSDTWREAVILMAPSDGGAAPLCPPEPVNAAHRYFISYSWRNREQPGSDMERADHLEVLLRRLEKKVERDEHEPPCGKRLDTHIRQMIERSDTFVAVISSNYLRSCWCPAEIDYALERQSEGLKPQRVVGIQLDDTRPSSIAIRLGNKLMMPGTTRAEREVAVRQFVDGEGK